MSAVKDGGPAFPCDDMVMRDNEGRLHGAPICSPGMSLRDWFAGQALAGLMGNSGGPIQASPMSGWGYTNCGPEDVAREAYGMADAMLAAREASDV